MKSDAIITVEGLGKRYSLRHQTGERYTALRDVLADKAKSIFRRRNSSSDVSISESQRLSVSKEDFWALKDVSFEVKQGEVLGIIGRNGAGKSTLLKILSRITDPTEGRIRIKGRVASLLEVGTGFHPELTGRENIFLNGAILGMQRREIKAKFDEIVAFAEVEKFLDTPVKRYSSGMYVRLAFAVAAHLEPEILVVDEVLAVGDAEFQEKCLGKMSEVARGGRTVLFVSHNMGAIGRLTQAALWLDTGSVLDMGSSSFIVEKYLSNIPLRTQGQNRFESFRRRRDDNSPVLITNVRLGENHAAASAGRVLSMGMKWSIDISLKAKRNIIGANITLIIKRTDGLLVSVITSWDNDVCASLSIGDNLIHVEIHDLCLFPGNYLVDIGIDPSMSAPAYDAICDWPLFSIVNTGCIKDWLERPSAAVHCRAVSWKISPCADSNDDGRVY
ncbi:MAG TPA: polysaccharide ABC transporter ATP-binding protein [Chthoniobacterales bacterium]|jgi:lipopolysaccharide transport system ATP-binding protein